jgi:hypothetical protein
VAGVALSGDVLDWICAHVTPTGPADWIRERPWATVAKFPVVGGCVWFKACAPVQAFEPRLTAGLATRWPDQLPALLGWDEQRAWLLLDDAGTVARDLGNPPELWLQALPAYAELQRGECQRASDHLSSGVPDLRTWQLPARYPELLQPGLPLDAADRERLRSFEPTFVAWCAELAGADVPDSIQHDDLHHGNLYLHDGRPRILDWGDSSVSHPFASLVVTFRFLERINGLDPADVWFARLRDAYLEPWGGAGYREVFDLAMRVGRFAHAIAWIRQRHALDDAARASFDEEYARVLARALALTV